MTAVARLRISAVGSSMSGTITVIIPAPAAERVCLVDGNEEALRWRLRLIRSAQSEIILSTFDFRIDESGSDVVAALLDAAERGVQVRLLVDGMNAQLHLQGSAAFQALAAHENAEVRFYNPLRLTWLWSANYRCHDKYLIIDHSAYLMGGRNTSDLFLGSGGTTRQNMDRDVVVCGDWNIAHQEIDLKNWKGNRKNSGFLPEERAWVGRLFAEGGWCDVYRQLYPATTEECYTWWSNRGQAWAKNVGWRLDYQLATPAMAASAQAASVYKERRFSDHAPLTIDYAYAP